MNTENGIELTNASSYHETALLREQISLPKADTGKDAWLFLTASFMVEALVWGFPFSYGLFQEYYFYSDTPFTGKSGLAAVGTLATGSMYLSAPLVFGAFKKWPHLRRPSCIVGLFIMCIALAASSFSTKVGHLMFTQGIIYAIGGSLAYTPVILFMDEWFIKNKGFAYGVMWAGTGLSGNYRVVIPIVLQWLLGSYGFKTALRTWSLALFILTCPLLYFLKPRLPVTQVTDHRVRKLFDLSFLKSPSYIILGLCNTIEAFGFFLPMIYLPTYAQRNLNASSLAGAFTVIAINIASVFGCIAMGSLIDRFHVTTCILISTIGATMSVFLFWGLTSSLPLLYIFCVTYGFFAGSFSSTWTGIIREVKLHSRNADVGMTFAFLAFGRGLGNVISGPLSEVLVKGSPWQDAALAYGSGYGPLIIFTGLTALMGGSSFFVKKVGYF